MSDEPRWLQQEHARRQASRRRHRIAVGLLLLVVLTPVVSVLVGLFWTSKGVDVERVGWLPEEATSVTYYRSFIRTAYEFSISEAGFRAWAEARGLRPSPPRATVVVSRQYGDGMAVPGPRQVAIDDAIAMERLDPQSHGGTTAVYDRRTGRAYVLTTPW